MMTNVILWLNTGERERLESLKVEEKRDQTVQDKRQSIMSTDLIHQHNTWKLVIHEKFLRMSDF
jgi:hypothetical protein